LDPPRSMHRDTAEPSHPAAREIKVLVDQGILHTLDAAELLRENETAIERAILEDCRDPEFIGLCEAQGPKKWYIHNQKVPKSVRDQPGKREKDRALQRLAGEIPWKADAYQKAYAEVYDGVDAEGMEYGVGE